MSSDKDFSLFALRKASESDASIPDGLVLFPNGRLVCRSHSLMICSFCRIDLRDRKENDDVDFENYGHLAEEEEQQLKYLYASKLATAPATPPPPPRPTRLPIQLPPIIDLTGSEGNNLNSLPLLQRGFRMVRPGPLTKDIWLGHGRVIPKKYEPVPASGDPFTLFSERAISVNQSAHRFIQWTNPREFLIFVHGLFLHNGNAGCSFTFHTVPPYKFDKSGGTVSFPLERGSPINGRKSSPPTKHRATLRAILAALRYRSWIKDGFTSLVIAVDSPTIVDCGTGCITKWIERGWKSITSGIPVCDSDLWQCILGEVEKLDGAGLSVKFWHTPRSPGYRASEGLRMAASLPPPHHFFDVVELSR